MNGPASFASSEETSTAFCYVRGLAKRSWIFWRGPILVTLACICYQAILLIFAHKSGPQAPNTQPGVWLVWTGPRPLPLLVFWSRQGSAFNLGWPKDQTTRKINLWEKYCLVGSTDASLPIPHTVGTTLCPCEQMTVPVNSCPPLVV